MKTVADGKMFCAKAMLCSTIFYTCCCTISLRLRFFHQNSSLTRQRKVATFASCPSCHLLKIDQPTQPFINCLFLVMLSNPLVKIETFRKLLMTSYFGCIVLLHLRCKRIFNRHSLTRTQHSLRSTGTFWQYTLPMTSPAGRKSPTSRSRRKSPLPADSCTRTTS